LAAVFAVAFTNDFLFDLGAREHKRVTLFRHAESDAEAMSLPMLLSCRCFCPPEIPDPSLSLQGTARATELGLHLAASKFLMEQEIELIVVSPLRRSLQTALLMFPPSTHQIPFVVSPMHREIVSTSAESTSTFSLLVIR
jgi:broad specificity phosphatase PhoE